MLYCILIFLYIKKKKKKKDKSTSINKIKTGSLKPLCDERLTKRGVGGRKVTINVRRKIIKKDSQQKMREI